MSMYRPQPGRHLYRHVGGDVTTTTEHAIGSFNIGDDDRLPPATIEDLGGSFVEGPAGQRFEVDQVFASSPRVVEATSQPPFGEWEEVHEIEIVDPDEAWERARNYGHVEEFGEIPTIDQDPVFQLNEIVNPLGHTVEWEGDFLLIRPTGAVHDHVCQHLATGLDDARDYLRSRAQRTVWTLDMQDPRYEVRRAHREATTRVVLIDVETGERSDPLDGGVTSGRSRTGEHDEPNGLL